MDNLSRQIDEIEALTSIYGEEWKVEDEENRSYSINISIGSYIVNLYLVLPNEYPAESPPVYQMSAPSLSSQQKHQISSGLEQVYLENIGEPVLYQWIEKVREMLHDFPINSSEVPYKNSVEMVAEYTNPNDMKIDIEPEAQLPAIIHSDTISDRKSVFQGHTAEVHYTEQVKGILKKLYENKKIANATHNIYAYRIYKEESKTFIQDCEDDGETQAGARLLHLLQILGVQNVLVVVTRWYGGIHLGPDRFRHINNAARQALELANFLPDNKMPKKRK